MLIGEVRFLRRSFRLVKSTGKQIAEFNAEADVMSYSDPALRQVDDETFARAQDLLASRAGRTKRGVNEIWLFSGQIFCGSCGNVCKSWRSNNKKGSYTYYGCGRQLGLGADRCDNRLGVREDLLMTRVKSAVAAVLEDLDGGWPRRQRWPNKSSERRTTTRPGSRARWRLWTARSSNEAAYLFDPDVDGSAKRSTRVLRDRSPASSASVRPSARACGPHSTAAHDTRPTTCRPSSMPTARCSWKPR